MTSPRPLLRAEGAAVLISACLIYWQWHGSWLWFAVLFLSPDLSMLGYLGGKKIGAAAYNLAHTYSSPLLLLLILWLLGQSAWSWLAVIWLGHIGFDRMLGYGLKYETAFEDTHLHKV